MCVSQALQDNGSQVVEEATRAGGDPEGDKTQGPKAANNKVSAGTDWFEVAR